MRLFVFNCVLGFCTWFFQKTLCAGCCDEYPCTKDCQCEVNTKDTAHQGLGHGGRDRGGDTAPVFHAAPCVPEGWLCAFIRSHLWGWDGDRAERVDRMVTLHLLQACVWCFEAWLAKACLIFVTPHGHQWSTLWSMIWKSLGTLRNSDYGGEKAPKLEGLDSFRVITLFVGTCF